MPWQNPTPGIVTLGAPNQLYNIAAKSVPANTTVTLTPQAPSPNNGYALCNTSGYEIYLSLSTASNSTQPFAKIRMDFYDDDNPGSPPIDTMIWWAACAQSPASAVYAGKGPMRGQYFSVQVTSQTNATPTVITAMLLWGSGRSYARDDWRSGLQPAVVPGWVMATSNTPGLQLADFGSNVLGVGASTTILLPLFAGKVYMRVDSTSTSNQGEFEVIPINVGGGHDIADFFGGASSGYIQLPRDHCKVVITNNSSASITTHGVIYIAEY